MSSALSLSIRPEVSGDAAAITRLHERAFGPGRYARTAFRLREGVPHDPALSFTALVGTLIVGSVRVTAVRCGTGNAFMLGPLTVDPAFEGKGIGAALMNASIAAARSAGHGLILLVGDVVYYGRFGFVRVPAGLVTLPGPVDPARLLALELREDALQACAGLVMPLDGA